VFALQAAFATLRGRRTSEDAGDDGAHGTTGAAAGGNDAGAEGRRHSDARTVHRGHPALENDAVLRPEIAAAAVLFPLGLYLGKTVVERALLVGSVLLVLIIELVNSAIETALDRVSLEDHPLAKRAKDIASAAVGLAIANAALVWALILFG
jgi:diacylglycerol kinase (ATP)